VPVTLRPERSPYAARVGADAREDEMPSDAERIQAAFDAAVGGDVEPLVDLFDASLEWRGVTTGHLWWRRTPS
jgi:ketosteroid isomerase-like protein